MMPNRSSLALALVLSAAPAVPAQAVDTSRLREEAAGTLRASLEDLALTARKLELAGERHRIFRMLLQFAPDHAEARRALRYSRGRDGRWVGSPDYREPRNLRTDGLPELRRDLDAALAAFRAFAEALLRREGRDALPADFRKSLLDDLVVLFPEDGDIRALRGEVRAGTRWAPRETVGAADRRKVLRAAAAAAVSAAPQPEPAEITALEAGLGLAWKAAVRTPLVRVAGTVDRGEIVAAARHAEAALAFFRSTFRTNIGLPHDFGIYLLAGAADRDAFVSRHPAYTEEERNRVRSFGGGWEPGASHIVEWGDSAEQRLDGALRHLVASLLEAECAITTSEAWAFEGAGLYLVECLTGTRLTWFIRGSRYGDQAPDPLKKKLMDSGTDWVAEGRKLRKGGEFPLLVALFRMDLNAMTPKDVLASFLFTGFLLECWPEEAPRFFRRLARSDAFDEAAGEFFGLALADLEARFHVWLESQG